MAKTNLKEIIVGREDEEHCPDVFVAVGREKRWRIITISGSMLEGFLAGIMLTKGIPLENIKNYSYGEAQPAYFKEHFVLPIYEKSFQGVIEHLQKYK